VTRVLIFEAYIIVFGGSWNCHAWASSRKTCRRPTALMTPSLTTVTQLKIVTKAAEAW